MSLKDELTAYAKTIPADLKEKKGVYTLEYTVAERKVLLSKKKLIYSAKFRIDDDKKELRFTEMLKESSSGMSSGDSDFGSGFGFKKESYKSGTDGKEGNIEQQCTLFGKQYNFEFDYAKVRKAMEAAAAKAGYAFKYHITPIGI